MRLIRLEINGFKSFPKKTEIVFDKGITAIVGPNGSGKSNIADSIRWVLGEQSAKTLRGSRMEDVIFGGTATRKALAYCEVTLVFENEDRRLPVDFAEVAITRRVYRSGESEYCLNGSTCRLRDIQDMLRDTGLGKEGYSIVGQGRVEEILSNRSGERRKAFEEAAGIMKYRVRKEDAERNLDNTRKNMTRLYDLLGELTDRLGPLGEQSEAAIKQRRLSEELKELEVNVFLYQHDRLTEKLHQLAETTEQLKNELENALQERVELSEGCAEAEENERKKNDELSALKTMLVSATQGAESLAGDIRVLEERHVTATKEQERLRNSIVSLSAKRDELTRQLGEGDDSDSERQTILERLRDELETVSSEILDINKGIEDKEYEIEQMKNAIIEAMNSAHERDILKTKYDATMQSYAENITRIETSRAVVQRKHDELSGEYTVEDAELKKLDGEFKDADRRVNAASANATDATMEYRRADEQLIKSERELEGLNSRLTYMLDMKRQHENYMDPVKRLLDDASRGGDISRYIEGVVAEVVNVPEEYEMAIEMAMGSSLQHVITQNDEAGKHILNYVREHNYGRITLYPMQSMMPRQLTYEERRSVSNVPGYIGVASELVNFDSKYANVIDYLLGRTIVVDDMDAGSRINTLTRRTLRIVTLKGDVFNPGGSMTGGTSSRRASQTSILGRERACADMLKTVSEKKSEIAALKRARDNAAQKLEVTKSTITELTRIRNARQDDVNRQREKVSIIKSQLDDVQESLTSLDDERARIDEAISDIKAQMDGSRDIGAVSANDPKKQAELSAKQTELIALRSKQSQRVEAQTDLKVRITALEKETDALKNERKRLSTELSSAIATIQSYEKSIEVYKGEEAELLSKKAEMEEICAEERAKNEGINNQCTELEQQRAQIQAKLTEMRTKREALDESIADKREQLSRQELSSSRAEQDINSMLDRLWTDYELTYENALPLRRQIAITQTNQRVSEIRQELRDLGPVNVTAIDEFREVSERYESEKRQYDDLESAEGDLIKLIGQLTDKMRVQFTDKFTQIRENFQRVFTELFCGGAADLLLGDPDDVLNCDIEIQAQIPGKKLQSLSPLSGGERALTAIALQFAILGLKPTAFCLLDEIDASLDEANVSRFANYIHAYSGDTQFILITHRKGSMEACDTLYGVSQKEKGVSSVFSAKLSQLLEEIA